MNKYYKVRVLIWTYEYMEHIFMPYSELFKNSYNIKAFSISVVNDSLD